MTAAVQLPTGLAPEVIDFLARSKQMFIDGAWTDAASGRVFETVDPATGQVLTTVPHAGPEDVERAVRAARRAFEDGPWRGITPAERQQIIWRIGEGIAARAEQFAQLESLDNGKSVAVAQAVDVTWAAEIFYYYAGWATKIEGRTIPVSVPWAPGARFHAFTQREAVGVCAQIIPWNFPLVMAAFKVAPALACGNTTILKPAEQTPLTAILLAEVLAEAGVPAGVFNLITGFGDVGASLAEHEDVDKVAFTGSTEVGKKIVHAAAGNLKKVSLELGGKSPQVIFADADLEAAIPGVASGFLFNHGQACTAGTRILVEDAVFDDFTAGLAEFAASQKIGPGLDPSNDIGPLISQEQLSKVTGYIDAGIADGARALSGGKRHGDSGFYVEPTLLVDVTRDFSVYQEEIFGPVAVAVPFDPAAGVRAAANDTPYGLAASVWTRDVSKAHTIASQIKAGTVWINCHNAFDTALPFGGYKQSGWGRELGEGAIAEYTQGKSVNIAL
ncbi:aldehyde dehydrogenase family protein [Tsukamurella ocularis]|uniref:aldehyde dehydrogenase family protein n=1 Tax=Tsukamurella ocularis TaxID=1970234 RepID=UPI002167453C|nr:aldehyde dehydrogenase family protein [Tsukamurella ocularis]MCS3781456.1 acyl-CoA reductase-like NAD-dependent aldehyde dehydrogenase [Tsukamurella ocularis]MCS3787828.1 acyl-CoA reductase-like NAD-dependent aldehyde dehydrogenase [Tsukamurella ocularis]MCS3851122.1 acyl-CoA reductase-like NAD-dependent aldehyde dehydrogenase [Tsukamurella ocularis]